MARLVLVALIVPRRMEMRYQDFVRERNIQTVFGFPCYGTASQSLLDDLGLEKSEKTLFLTALDRSKAVGLLQGCVRHLGLEIPGNGIAFLIPFDAAGGKRSLDALTAGQKYELPEVKSMEHPDFPYSLLVAICQSGCTDMVMDAAREAGARGGTVVHAKGTVGGMVRQFLGVSLAEEKEIILILSSRQDRDKLMRAIMDQAGISSEAHTILFSLPVDEIAGLRSIVHEKPQEEEEV